MALFVQIGATRDGTDPYLHVARGRGMEAVLVETSDYILLRQTLGRLEFDYTLAVDEPSDPQAVAKALAQLSEVPALILAGFERYIYSAYKVANLLKIPPYDNAHVFVPPNKAQQRDALAHATASYASADAILQPRYVVQSDVQIVPAQTRDFTYPLVVKPVDGGGGLGVFLVHTPDEVKLALERLQSITNYDGGQFEGLSLEEYVSGTEYSVQGLVHHGKATVLTFCKKFVLLEEDSTIGSLHIFREVGHLATRGDRVEPVVKQFAQTCVDVFGYYTGPFHIDMVKSGEGYAYLEMGFRLSGFGLTRLVQRVSGYDWAREAFEAHLGKPALQPSQLSESPYIGQFTAISATELEKAEQLAAQGYCVEVQRFTTTTPDPTSYSARLKSDLTRHGGAVGRVIASAETLEEVEKLLQFCSPARLKEKTVFVTQY
ncbi:ATP-grasp domain-containing protein [Tengunoibacter tsumagoiensis]|uniref:ATP-grasp domain-containing protein n=1 Tax=Tengunoibacter tsumagoiensis TaxID=2014871 RepID=A0A402A9J5_9CHLR|nr:ATP-grasp domain-containing protein [Tengunoibacter tsumagoiensis]GCE15832.1 hypothetical protein KTT_56910 [Tengunoibacter tsumagoiensis]